MDYIKWFKEISPDDLGITGGKGLNLGIMSNLGLPIPAGFVITAQTYDSFITKTKIKQQMFNLLKGLDIEQTESLQKVSKKIQELIIENYDLLSTDKGKVKDLLKVKEAFVAVRSSATAEDLPDASFAGQQASFLNVKGKDNLINSVRECWASLFTARAIYYREKNHFPHDKVLIAVVVQRMVNSDKSGIMFTINPSTNANELVIEAIYGLGEAIVSGSVNPHQYVVDKDNKKIKKIEVKKQDWGLF